MLQRLPIALAQVKAENNSESLQMKSDKLLILCINQNKSQKGMQQHNQIYSITNI